jgi:hypothetical protein
MSVELNQAAFVSPQELCFDTENPRLAAQYGLRRGSSDEEVINSLKEVADLDELLLSIASNGYIKIEPMIIIGKKPPYKVIEGNRRLAAIKLFQNPELAKKCRISIPESSIDLQSDLKEVLVYRVSAEAEARSFIGFKHINGPHKWDSLAKAKYAAEWFQEGKSVDEISRFIGDSFSTVKKMLHGWMVLDQAQNEGLFDIQDRYPTRQFSFSHLYVALTRNQIRSYLGMDPSFAKLEISQNPIPNESLPELKNLLEWLYGSEKDKIKPVISSQNPDVKNLAEVLANSKSRTILETTGDLSKAHSELTPAETLFEKSLFQAESFAKQALGNVYSYKGGDVLLESAKSLFDISENILLNLESAAKKLKKVKKG